LSGVVTALAAERGLVSYVKRDRSVTREDFRRSMLANSLVAVVARSEADIANLVATGEWKKQVADPSLRPWTDDFSNVLAAMWRMAGTK
jgi:hypothetical protein